VPASYSLEPTAFGYAMTLRWKTSEDQIEAARIQASKIQHLYAVRIRQRMADESVTPKRFATESRISYDRLMKVLRGDVIMRLEDIASADLTLKEVSEFAVHDASRRRAYLASGGDRPRGSSAP
jgi:hypothetical protein